MNPPFIVHRVKKKAYGAASSISESSLLIWGVGYREGRVVKEELRKFGCSKCGGYWP